MAKKATRSVKIQKLRKMSQKKKTIDIRGCKADVIITKEFDWDDNLIFTAYDNVLVDNIDAWYIDGGTINHKTN